MTDAELFAYIKNKKRWDKIKTKNHELNYMVELFDEKIFLLFQESDGKKDWKDNLNFFPIYTKVYKEQESPLKVHCGFAKEYKSGNDTIMSELIEFHKIFPEREIVIAGWSNGAAMATLACEDFFFRTGTKCEVVTFGSPKVCFDKKSASYIYSCCNSFREYCHQSDIVTKLPPFGEHINEYKLGKLSLGIFNPWKWHTNYDKFIKGDFNE